MIRIWKPDTYFLNGLNSELHTLTQPNKFVRLSNTGKVHFSSRFSDGLVKRLFSVIILMSYRLTIVAKCPMFLRKYPLDSQRCPLTIGSCKESWVRWQFGLTGKLGFSVSYRTSEITFHWKKVGIYEDMRLSQFALSHIQLSNYTFEKQNGLTRLNWIFPITSWQIQVCFRGIFRSWNSFSTA